MHKITELFAFVSCNKDTGDEGLVAMQCGSWVLPMIGADVDRLEEFKPIADEMMPGNYKILKFRLVETIGGDREHE